MGVAPPMAARSRPPRHTRGRPSLPEEQVMSSMKDKVERAADWVKEKTGMGAGEGSDVGVAGIRERMDVIGSCGNKLGVVDHVEGGSIKLTRKDSADGE